jgi:hypothetical protein
MRAIAVSLARFGTPHERRSGQQINLAMQSLPTSCLQTARTADTLLWKVSAHRSDEWDRGDCERLSAATDTVLSSADRG